MSASTRPFARLLPLREEHLSLIPGGRTIPEERRQKFRYHLDLRVRFCPSFVESRLSGSGMIINISSGGVLVASSSQPLVGELVEMRIEWPLLLHGRIPLQLMAMGRVVRRGPSRFAAAFERHEFRTMKRSGQA
jgi:hypothetical protein